MSAWQQPEIAQAWIAAGKLLAVDAAAQVPCPVCARESLVIQDVVVEGTPKFERIMSCPNCHSRNVLLMHKRAAE